MSRINIMPEKEKHEILKYVEERFGIRKAFDDYVFIKRGKKIWIASKGLADKKFSGLNVEAAGMLFIRIEKKKGKEKIKLTTNAAQIFGKYAGKNTINLSRELAEKVARGYDLRDKDLREIKSDAEDGYVILKYGSHILGIGLKQGRFIKNTIPKARRIKAGI